MASTTPAAALRRLLDMAASGALDRFCEEHAVELLVAFGSAVRSPDEAADLDLAVRFQLGAPADALGLREALVALLGLERIDVMDLERAGVVGRYHALVAGVEPLYERRRGLYAEQQIRAALEFMDTAWLRRLDLELMAESE